MIRRLKLKFIILSMTTLLVMLTAIVASMNIISYNSIAAEADQIVSVLSENKGKFPEPHKKEQSTMLEHMSPEIPYESRYFWVLMDTSGNIVQAETSKITSVSTADAIDFAKEINNNDKKSGFISFYRYNVSQENNNMRITFLDCRRDLDSFNSFRSASIAMAAAGYVIVFFVIIFFSGRIVRPVAEIYSKQKRFITDAGHEIKTPLAIINANADILEMEYGENESISDIKDQIKKLSDLTNELICLARMEESGNSIIMSDINISNIAKETIHEFKAPAQMKNIEFFCNIQPELTMKGEKKAISQLFSVLIDNSIKYAPENSIISVDLRKENKVLSLHILNISKTPINSNELTHVFDRFYRPDLSRSNETGGYGIGLSIAKVIVNSHKGRIRAWTPDGKSFHITITFPATTQN